MRCFLSRAEAPVEEPTLLAPTQARIVTSTGRASRSGGRSDVPPVQWLERCREVASRRPEERSLDRSIRPTYEHSFDRSSSLAAVALSLGH